MSRFRVLTGELDVISGPALAVLRLTGVVAHVADLELPESEGGQRVVLLQLMPRVGQDALSVQVPSYLKMQVVI